MRSETIARGQFCRALLFGALVSAGMPGALARGGDPAPTGPSPLPTTAPAPDVVMRESFGLADLLRPASGKGTLKDYNVHTSISGFWIEYPGSKDTAWLAPSEGKTWRVCASTSNPYEMPSPLQVTWGDGCLISIWTDPVIDNPTALMPFRAPAGAYEVSINGYPAPVAGKFIAVGFTSSTLLTGNLETSASVWALLRPGPALDNNSVLYELRVNGMSGPLLVSGEMATYSEAFNRLALRYDPAAETVSASLNETELGTFPLAIPSPKFIGIEGVGFVDNFVVRTLP